MPMMSLFLNVLWIVFGGLEMAVGWLIAAVIMAITIIGLPWARAAVNIAGYTLLPFGQMAVSRAEYSGREDVGTGPLGVIGNIIWFVRLVAGAWSSLDRDPLCHHDHRDPVCLGAPEARGPCALADWKSHCAAGRRDGARQHAAKVVKSPRRSGARSRVS